MTDVILKPNGWGKFAIYTVVTALAAAFNILVIIVIGFVLMPRVDQAIEETAKNRDAIRQNREEVQAYQKELEDHRQTLRRLNAALDAAEARAKAMSKKKE